MCVFLFPLMLWLWRIIGWVDESFLCWLEIVLHAPVIQPTDQAPKFFVLTANHIHACLCACVRKSVDVYIYLMFFILMVSFYFVSLFILMVSFYLVLLCTCLGHLKNDSTDRALKKIHYYCYCYYYTFRPCIGPHWHSKLRRLSYGSVLITGHCEWYFFLFCS